MKEIFLATIQYSSWPLALFLCFWFTRKEIRSLLGKIKGLKTGPLELQFSEQISAQGLTPEQLAPITELTADEIDLFYLVTFSEIPGFNYSVPFPAAILKKRLIKLEKAGLIEILNTEDPGEDIRHNPTSLGLRIRSALINSSAQLVRSA